jgi:hypothetical protein
MEGMMTRVRMVAVIKPETTTVASGRTQLHNLTSGSR